MTADDLILRQLETEARELLLTLRRYTAADDADSYDILTLAQKLADTDTAINKLMLGS